MFFAIRDDKFKQTSNVDNDMRIRNRFIREQIRIFDNHYHNFREKMKKY
jgi:hypothetical protein